MELKIDNLIGELAPLYCCYDQQHTAQRAYVEIDENGIITADYSGEIGVGVPESVWHGRTLQIAVASAVNGAALYDYLTCETTQKLLDRIITGHGEEYNGSNYVGTLTTDAENAIETLELELSALPYAQIWSPAEWLEQNSLGEILQNESIPVAAERLLAEAIRENIYIDGSIEKYLANRVRKCWKSE